MNRTIWAALAAGLAGALLISSAAAAQGRRELVIRVQPRSYFDAGNVVPKGSMSSYAEGPTFFTAPVIENIGTPYGDSQLPPRIGGGRNPFGAIGE